MDEDVTKLTDEELNARINGEQPEEPEEVANDPDTTEEPSQDEPAQDEPADEPEVKATEEEPEVTEQKPPSRRETLRIQDILAKRERTAQPAQQPDRLDYQNALDADPETVKQLETDRQNYGQVNYNQGLEQAKNIQFHTRLEVDAPKVESRYKFLDKNDKQNFDPVRADAMNTLYLQATGYDAGDPNRGVAESVQNPNIRYSEFVEAQMEFAEALMAESQSRTTKNIAKQTATTGLRPDGSSAKLDLTKDPELMTDEELQARIDAGLR